MMNVSNLLNTIANTYLNKFKDIGQAIGTNNVNENRRGQAKILSEKSAETALKDYNTADVNLERSTFAEHSDKIENISDQLIDDILLNLVTMLAKEIDGKIEL